MFYQLFVKTLCCSLLTLQVWAAPKEKPVTHYVAIAAANTINTLGTVDAYVKWLSHFAPASDIEKLKAEFTKHGINMGDKFPKMHYKNDKAYFDKKSEIVFGTETLTINGKKLVLSKQPIHALFSNICMQIQCEKTTADFSLFPKAYAKKFDWGNALLGAIGVGALAKLVTGDSNSAWKGALVGGIGGGFINFENNNSCNYGGHRCEVTCEGGDYYTERPQPRPYYDEPARSGRVRIYPSTTRQAYGDGYQPCDQASQQSRDQLAYDIENGGYGTPYYPTPGGQDQLQDDIGGATPTYSDSKNAEKKRGTTSLPAKKK